MTELSFVTKKGKLVPEQEWIEHIRSLHGAQMLESKQEAITLLKEAFVSAVKKRLPKKHFGIMFSGGVDSTLIAFICKKLGAHFTCYTVGIEGSKDIAEGLKAAINLGFNIKTEQLNQEDVKLALKETIQIIEETSVVNVGVGATALCAIKRAKLDGVDFLFSGLGSEEIFAGYERHAKADDINKECWTGLEGMWQRDLVRDSKIATHTKIEVATPFLDEDLIRLAMCVPGELKITGEHKKLILREVAISLGMPEEFAMRKKLAAQYGSGIDKEMERLAKAQGFNSKSEYLLSLRN